MCMCMCVCVYVCVCIQELGQGREGERQEGCVCVYVYVCMCVYVYRSWDKEGKASDRRAHCVCEGGNQSSSSTTWPRAAPSTRSTSSTTMAPDSAHPNP